MFYFPWLCCAFIVCAMLMVGKLSLVTCACVVLILIMNRKNMLGF